MTAMIVAVRLTGLQDGSMPVSGPVSLTVGDGYEIDSPAAFEGSVTGIGDGLYLVSGVLSFSARTLCARCATPVENAFSVSFDERFAREGQVRDDEDIYTFTGFEIDLTDALSEAATMALPFRSLCREDCAGLCPVCGADRNQNDCGHGAPDGADIE
jgi:uncharacterized protein